MIASRRTAGKEVYQVAVIFVNVLNIRLAAHIQPRIEACHSVEILILGADTCHLAVKSNLGNFSNLYTAVLDTTFYCLGISLVEVIALWFHNTRLEIKKSGFELQHPQLNCHPTCKGKI